MIEERKAHYKKHTEGHDKKFIREYKRKISEEAKTKYYYYMHVGREEYFRKIITSNAAIASRKQDGSYELKI